MKWSIKLGRFLGIDVYLHVTFLVFLVFIAGLYAVEGESVAAGLEGVLFFASVFGCVLLHEYGHALMARRFGVGTRDITLLPIGGVARLERMPDRPIQELWVALAGPAVNVVLAMGLSLYLVVAHGGVLTRLLELGEAPFAERLLFVNLMLVAFNLIPAFPMDGGRVLRSLLALRMDYTNATRVAAALGRGIALVFAALGLWGTVGGAGNPMLLFIAGFVWIGASRELVAARFRSALGVAGAREVVFVVEQSGCFRPPGGGMGER